MSHKEATTHKQTQDAPAYDSNPFTLSFRAMMKFFSTNANWAIVIVILAFLGALAQTLNQLGGLISDSSSSNDLASSGAGTATDPTVIIAIVIVVFVFVLIAVIVGTVIDVFLRGMFAHVALESEKDRAVSFNEAFKAVTGRFWRLFLAQLLANLKIFGWTLLLIVPGIIAAMRYYLLTFVIMSEPANQGAIKQSHDRVKVVTKGRIIEVFGLSTVAAIVPFVGSLLGLSGGAALYRQLEHYTDNNIQKPSIHWLNYLGLFLLVALFGFILFIATLALVIASLAK